MLKMLGLGRISNLNYVACNCAKLRATVLELRAIMRNCAQFLGVYRARNCAQVKLTCVGNPKTFVIIVSSHAQVSWDPHVKVYKTIWN